jgi:hypothetical protein
METFTFFIVITPIKMLQRLFISWILVCQDVQNSGAIASTVQKQESGTKRRVEAALKPLRFQKLVLH